MDYEDDLEEPVYDPSPSEALLREKQLRQRAIARHTRRLAEIDRELERLLQQDTSEPSKTAPC